MTTDRTLIGVVEGVVPEVEVEEVEEEEGVEEEVVEEEVIEKRDKSSLNRHQKARLSLTSCESLESRLWTSIQ